MPQLSLLTITKLPLESNMCYKFLFGEVIICYDGEDLLRQGYTDSEAAPSCLAFSDVQKVLLSYTTSKSNLHCLVPKNQTLFPPIVF